MLLHMIWTLPTIPSSRTCKEQITMSNLSESDKCNSIALIGKLKMTVKLGRHALIRDSFAFRFVTIL